MEASAMTYMVGGKQYIALSGYGKMIGYSLADGGEALTTATGVRPTAPSGSEETRLPAGPGRDAAMRACTSCHGAQVWSGARLSRSEWDETMKRMTTRGMTLTADEYTTVLDYLSTQLSGSR